MANRSDSLYGIPGDEWRRLCARHIHLFGLGGEVLKKELGRLVEEVAYRIKGEVAFSRAAPTAA